MGRVPAPAMGGNVVYEICSSNDCLLALEGGGLQYGCRVPMLQTVGPSWGREEPEAKMARKMTWEVVLWDSFRSWGTIWGIVF